MRSTFVGGLTLLLLIVLVLASAGCAGPIPGTRWAPSEAVAQNADLAVKTAMALTQTAETEPQKALAQQNLEAAAAVQTYIGLPDEPVPMSDVMKLASEDSAERARAQEVASGVSAQASLEGAQRPTVEDALDAASAGLTWIDMVLGALGVGGTGTALLFRKKLASGLTALRQVVVGNDAYWTQRRAAATSAEELAEIEAEYQAWLRVQRALQGGRGSTTEDVVWKARTSALASEVLASPGVIAAPAAAAPAIVAPAAATA